MATQNRVSQHESEAPAIVLDHLSKDYLAAGRAVRALSDCTLTIAQGELFGLFGPNGAGKSTLIRILCTLLAPSSGSASVCGFDVVRQSADVRRRIAVVTESERAFHGRLTARQNLEFYAALHNIPRTAAASRISDLLNDFGLVDAAHRSVQTFSSGMRQRLVLVRALLHDPPVFLLDEPTSSMDVNTADFVRRLVKDELVGKRKKTVLYTTHDLYEMDRFCDRVAILNGGRIVALGAVADLLGAIDHSERFLVTCTPAADETLAALRRIPAIHSATVARRAGGQCDIEVVLAPSSTPPLRDIWAALLAHEQSISGFERLDRDAIGRVLRHYSKVEANAP